MPARDSSSRGLGSGSQAGIESDSDRELAQAPTASELSRAGREKRRSESARQRDLTAGSRDTAADIRDRAAEQEHDALLVIELARDSTIRTLLATGGAVRDHAAADRAGAASDRQLAAADRGQANTPRGSADVERQRRRDETAGSRDRAADARDREAEGQEHALLVIERERDSIIRVLLLAGGLVREYAAADRADAASDRHGAAADRADASTDSGQARLQLQQAQLDGLTGARTRDLGRAVLQHEIDRAGRSGEPFVLAFVDVDGLKQLNDREGHAAGDALLQTVVSALRAQLRSYDPIVRVGGDEFLCGFTNTRLDAARRRIEEVRDALQQGPTKAAISVGLAMLGDRDTLEKLIARADADMYTGKPRGRAPRE